MGQTESTEVPPNNQYYLDASDNQTNNQNPSLLTSIARYVREIVCSSLKIHSPTTESDDLAAVRYMYENGRSWDDHPTTESNDLAAVRYMYENGRSWDDHPTTDINTDEFVRFEHSPYASPSNSIDIRIIANDEDFEDPANPFGDNYGSYVAPVYVGCPNNTHQL